MLKFEVTVTFDEATVRWGEGGETATDIAEEIGVMISKRLGFDVIACTSFSSDANSITWKKRRKPSSAS